MINNGRAIAVNYRPGAGGNFVQNCLALSKHCVFRHREWAQQQLDYGNPDPEFYQKKLEWALQTIAPVGTTWLNYELGANTFVGFIFADSRPTVDSDFPDVIHRAAEQGLWTTHTAHNYGYTEHIHRYWPTVKHICVHGNNWADKWQPKKNPELNVENEKLGWVTSQTPADIGYHFDFDSAIDSEAAFVGAMENLYKWLDFDDFNPALVAEFYRAYAKVHFFVK